MTIYDKINKLLDERRGISIDEILKNLNEHPGVVKRIIKKMKKEGKITIEKRKNKHKDKKFDIIIS